MRTKYFLVLVLTCFLWGCSKDDQAPETIDVSAVSDFTALGQDLENVYQYNYSAGTEEGELINLTKDNALSNQFLTLRQNGEVLTFFVFSAGNFSALQRNIRTGESRFLENIYAVSDDRSVIWGSISPEKLFFGYYSPRGTNNLGMRIVDISTKDITDIALENEVQSVYDPLYHEGKLYVTILSGSGDYRTLIFDTSVSALLATWDFGSAIPSLFVEKSGDITVITGGDEYVRTLYDSETLEKLGETSFALNHFFSPGPLQAQLIDNRLYYLNFYAQPSPALYGPAVYDFIKKENRVIDMVGIIQELERESGQIITLTAYHYLPEGRVFLLGYTKDFNSGLFQGGILVISEEGELLHNLQASFIPIYFTRS
jgi:hypothetical protein